MHSLQVKILGTLYTPEAPHFSLQHVRDCPLHQQHVLVISESTNFCKSCDNQTTEYLFLVLLILPRPVLTVCLHQDAHLSEAVVLFVSPMPVLCLSNLACYPDPEPRLLNNQYGCVGVMVREHNGQPRSEAGHSLVPGDQLSLRGGVRKECWRNGDAYHTCLDNTSISHAAGHAVQCARLAQYVPELPCGSTCCT